MRKKNESIIKFRRSLKMATNEKEKFDLSGALKGFAEHYEDGNSP